MVTRPLEGLAGRLEAARGPAPRPLLEVLDEHVAAMAKLRDPGYYTPDQRDHAYGLALEALGWDADDDDLRELAMAEAARLFPAGSSE